MNISVFGVGYVGAVLSACLAEAGHLVIAIDANPAKVAMVNEGKAPLIEPGLDTLIARNVAAGRLRATLDIDAAIGDTDLSFVCVGTPSRPNGRIDYSYVLAVAEEIGTRLAAKPGRHHIVVRSTMVPGSMEAVVIPALERASGRTAGAGFGIAYYPEFLRESTAIEDYHDPGTVVIGELDAETADLVAALNARNGGTIFRVPLRVSEAIKYANNAWHALKVSFANEIGLIARGSGVDGRRIMEVLCADRRLNISPAYLKPGFAYGGSCLPKDLRGLRSHARDLDIATPLLDAIGSANERHIAAAFDLVEAIGKRRVALIGLSFKSNTDDLRESPFVELAERLFGKGYEVRIHDPHVTYSHLMGANRAYVLARIPHLYALLDDDLATVVASADTIVVGKPVGASGPSLASLVAPHQHVIDLTGAGRDCAALPNYQGLCWP